jgi:hypothetical protein
VLCTPIPHQALRPNTCTLRLLVEPRVSGEPGLLGTGAFARWEMGLCSRDGYGGHLEDGTCLSCEVRPRVPLNRARHFLTRLGARGDRKGGEEDAMGWPPAWMADLAFEDAELVTQRENLGPESGVGVTANDQDLELDANDGVRE